LAGKRALGLHSGILSQPLQDLLRAGVITGTSKTLDPGLHVATGVLDDGSDDARSNWGPGVTLQPVTLTHAPARLLRQERLWAVNSAFEVDLAGQPNAEFVGGLRIASGGGQADFVRAAHNSLGGAAVLALPARTSAGRSRIVAHLSPPHVPTSPGSDVDVVVTEYGAAHLRGKTARQRALALISIAHPEDRAILEQALADRT
jgi:acyl-CoA hydrolase